MRLQKKHASRGFTLTELLTVGVIVAIALALVSPAVMSARLDARDKACEMRLKRMGLALHNYHDVYLTFPPGWTGHFPDAGPTTRYGWQVKLLPYVEHAPLYDRMDPSNQRAEPKTVFQQPIPVFRCPADSTPDTNSARGDYGTSNYSGNFGPRSLPRWGAGGFSEFWPGRAVTSDRTDGIFCWNSYSRIAGVLDGTSFTFLVGERSATSGAGIWMGVRGNDFEDDQVTDCSFGNEINSGSSSFSSRHPGGAYFLFGDGQVRLITEEIDSRSGDGQSMGTFQKLAHKSDGNSIDEF